MNKAVLLAGIFLASVSYETQAYADYIVKNPVSKDPCGLQAFLDQVEKENPNYCLTPAGEVQATSYNGSAMTPDRDCPGLNDALVDHVTGLLGGPITPCDLLHPTGPFFDHSSDAAASDK